MEEAIKKIESEMNMNKNNPYVIVVGQFLLNHLKVNPKDAEKINNKEKTILNSLNAMKNEAEKKEVGNCAVLTDQEGFMVVLKYFDIEEAGKVIIEHPMELKTNNKGNANHLDISLDDLL